MSNYGGRTGMYSIIKFTKEVCRIYGVFAPTIISFVDGSTLSSDDKATVKAWLNGATAACAILQTVEVKYEE